MSRVARAAALLLQGPQFPAERAARQGDRGVHRGGQGRPARRSSCISRSAACSAGAARYDRAIRMHQNLLERADLARRAEGSTRWSSSARTTSRPGILDRAEEVFIELRKARSRRRRAAHLLEIYQQEKDWAKRHRHGARARVRRRRAAQKRNRAVLLRARGVRRRRSRARMRRARHLESALEANRKCVRASLLLGDLEQASGRRRSAPSSTGSASSQQNPAYLALVAQRLLEAYRDAGRAEEGLHAARAATSSAIRRSTCSTWCSSRRSTRKGAEAAYKLVRDELRRNPTLLGLDRLLEAQIIAAARPSAAATSSWCETWCTATPGAWRAIAARTAASRRASSTGNARPAAAGKPIRRDVPRNSISRP